MMVADDDINAFAGSISDLLNRLDTAVEGDDERTSLLRCVVNTLLGYAIALGIAVGDVVVDCG